MKLKKSFSDFYDEIRIRQESEPLKEKREILENNIRSKFPDELKKHGIELKKSDIDIFDQGSYKYHTTIKDTVIDRDIAVIIPLNIVDNPDARKIKGYLRDALDYVAAREVNVKEPCVNVAYYENGEEWMQESLDNSRKVNEIMNEQYGKNWYYKMTNNVQIKLRFEELRETMVENHPYKQYLLQSVELEQLCRDDEQYVSLEEELERISSKEGKRRNKEEKFIDKKIELLQRKNQLAIEKWGHILDCPEEYRCDGTYEVESEFEKKLRLVESILSLPKEKMNAKELINEANMVREKDML